MSKLPINVLQFAGEKADTYEAFRDYFFNFMASNHKRNLGVYDDSHSLASKEEKMNKLLFEEIKRISGQSMSNDLQMQVWAQNPMIKWAAVATVDTMIESVLPDTIIDSIGLYTNIANVGWGETMTYEIKPNDLFTVSQGSNAQRTVFRQKQFKTSKTLVPVNHDITVYASLYRVLCGQESLAEFVRKAVISIETAMSKDAYNALVTLVDGASFPSALKHTGFSMDTLINFCQTVTAYNAGNKAVIVGTTRALMKVLPDSTLGYRINTPANGMSIQLIKDVYDYDILVLPQVASNDGSYGLVLDDTKLYIMSPSTDKIVKGVVEGVQTTNGNEFYENADLTQNITFNKRWAFEAITNATMAVMTVA